MTQSTNVPDPFAEALDPKQPANVTYGQILFDVFFCCLIKGQGKVVYDPTQHSPRQRRTGIKVDIVPLPESGQQWDISREFIAEIRTDGWLQVTLPSLRDVGVDDLKAMNEQYVKAELVTYGTYEKNGQEKELTAPKILAVYASREDCLKAWETDEPEATAKAEVPGFEKEETLDEINDALFGPESNGKPPVNEGQRKVALNFLPGIVKGCREGNGMNLELLAQKLGETPLIKDHFTMESPEVLEAIEKALADPAW